MKRVFIVVVALFLFSHVANANFRGYLLGDIDDFQYEGTGSEDDVYIDPDFYSLMNPEGLRTVDDFDVLIHDHDVAGTFLFPLGPSETVVGAQLTVAIRSMSHLVTTDAIMLDGLGAFNMFAFEDLGWLPVTETGVDVKTLDLSNVLGSDFLPMLQDGQFHIRLWDDVAVDYAALTVEVVPEPLSLSVLSIGFGLLLRKGKHNVTS